MDIISIVSAVTIILGLVFFAGGAVGIIRFPDFYSRLHPAGMLDSMGLVLSMGGMALYVMKTGHLIDILSGLKIILVVMFVYITSPTATHAIVDAGVRAGMKPWTKDEEEQS